MASYESCWMYRITKASREVPLSRSTAARTCSNASFWIASARGPRIGETGSRTVYVPHGTPVRLRETIRAAKVWVKDADGEAVKGEVDLHEGWFALPVPEEE